MISAKASKLTRIVSAAITAALFAFTPIASKACLLFGDPDAFLWQEHATAIIDGTIRSFERRSLVFADPSDETSQQEDETWVLMIEAHNTIRGEHEPLREVATRMLSTTIVGADYLKPFVGLRREFALMDGSPDQSLSFLHPPDAYLFSNDTPPPEPYQYVQNQDETSLDEIWEGICTKLPIFPPGTFDP